MIVVQHHAHVRMRIGPVSAVFYVTRDYHLNQLQTLYSHEDIQKYVDIHILLVNDV
jgi:hypothetical protein